jgi:hypothetical protein
VAPSVVAFNKVAHLGIGAGDLGVDHAGDEILARCGFKFGFCEPLALRLFQTACGELRGQGIGFGMRRIMHIGAYPIVEEISRLIEVHLSLRQLQ